MKRAWKVGDIVIVNDIKANKDGVAAPCKWTGRGLIDMVQHGGDYIRVVAPPFYAWVNRSNFNQVKFESDLATAQPPSTVME